MALSLDINTNLRKLAGRVVSGVLRRFGDPVGQQASTMLSTALDNTKAAVAQRSASIPPPEVPGTGQPWGGTNVKRAIDRKQQRLFGSAGARYGKAASYTGPTPGAYSAKPEINLGLIARVHTHVERNGYMWDKSDLDERIVREHEHLHPADRSRRAWIFSTHPSIRPRNKTTLALLVRNAVQGVIDDLDGFDSSVCEAQIANRSGASLQEIVWRRRRLRVPVSAKAGVLVECDTVASLETIPLRSVAFDVENDRPYVNMGGWGWIDPLMDPRTGLPLRKVVYYKGYGDGPARMRGYGFAAHHLHWLSKLSWEKWAMLAEVYGVSTPYLQFRGDEQVSDEDIAQGQDALADLGKCIPVMISDKLGKIETTPTPSAITPIHQALIGYCNTGLSKLVTGQTLAMEMGASGSYNASETHADQQEAVQRIDSRGTGAAYSEQLFRYICEVNAACWATAFARYCPGEECTPEAIMQCVPKLAWDVSRNVTKTERLNMFVTASDHGLAIDPDQVYDECGLRPPLDGAARFGTPKADAAPVENKAPVEDKPPTADTSTADGATDAAEPTE